MDNLVGVSPEEVLIHGPTKRLVDHYLWHEPQLGIVGSYTPTAFDVHDHFGLFRGVDQIESFGQTIGGIIAFLECQKQGCTLTELKSRFMPTFLSIGRVTFHSYLKEGDTFVSLGQLKFYKFRQLSVDGRIYKVPPDLDLNDYFGHLQSADFINYQLHPDFVLVTEIDDITGRIIKNERLKIKYT